MFTDNLQKTIYNFIKTIECQRYITSQTIKDYVISHSCCKYPNKNLNNVWFSCNHHFYSGIYIYLHKYQKLIKERFSENIDLSSISEIERNVNILYPIFSNCKNKEEFIENYSIKALNDELDTMIND